VNVTRESQVGVTGMSRSSKHGQNFVIMSSDSSV
jgi:hypothetical protein